MREQDLGDENSGYALPEKKPNPTCKRSVVALGAIGQSLDQFNFHARACTPRDHSFKGDPGNRSRDQLAQAARPESCSFLSFLIRCSLSTMVMRAATNKNPNPTETNRAKYDIAVWVATP